MNKLAKSIAAVALILAVANPVYARINPDIVDNVRSAAGANSNISVVVLGGTVTMFGYVESVAELLAIEKAAKDNGATEVLNGVETTNQ